MVPMGITLFRTAGRARRAAIDRSGFLLYDSDCGICLATAGWLGKRVVPRRLGLLPLSEADTEPRIGRLVSGRPLTTTIHFVRADDTILTGARAVLAAVRPPLTDASERSADRSRSPRSKQPGVARASPRAARA